MSKKLYLRVPLLAACVLTAAAPVSAQVQQVAMRTPGIACGACAAIAEIGLRRLDGIDSVTISKSQEAVMIVYKPGAIFQPSGIRQVLEPLGVKIAQLQIKAQGRLQEQGGKRVFVAGKDKLSLVPSANAPQIAVGRLVTIEAVVNDRSSPMELTLMTVTPVKNQ